MTMVMTTVMNRAAPRGELRTRIYSAAIAAFRELGYERATIEAITARAGVAKGTFFNFYKAKLDVLIEYYWQIDARLAPLREDLDARTPLRSLVQYVQECERLFEREGGLLVDLLLQTQRLEALRAVDAASGDADARQFAAFFARARTLGKVRKSLDPDNAAALLIDVWAGTWRTWQTKGRKVSLAAIFKLKMSDVFRGFAAEGAHEAA